MVSPWLRLWVLESVVTLPLNINSYHICRCCHALSLVAAEATFLWSLLFTSVSCSLCCMGFSTLFCLKSRCAWLVLKFSLHQLFTCKHSLTLCLMFVPCVCSECALQVASNFVAVVCCGFLFDLFCFFLLCKWCSLSHKPVFPCLSNLALISHTTSLFHTWPLFDVQSSHTPFSHTQPFFDVQTSQTFFFSYPTPFHTINDHWLVDGWPRMTKCSN